MFLNVRVLTRSLRTSRYLKERRRRGENDEAVVVRQTLSAPSVNLYVAALVSLYQTQVAEGSNPHPHPRGAKLKAVLEHRLRQESVRKKIEYADRAAGTMIDGYDPRHLQRFVRACWTSWSQGRGVSSPTVEAFLRTSCDFLIAHQMLLRGESRRTLEFPDLFSLELKNEGPTTCTAMVLIMHNGKTNQHNRLEYAVSVRNKDPLLCPLSQLACYLFYRWNVVREPVPQFQQRQLWYDLKVVKGSAPTNPLSYETHLQWTNKIFALANLSSLKKTHAGRKNGALEAELNGVSEAQIRRAGRWNSDALSTCYLSHLPREFVRSMAGFNPHVPGNYYLPRAQVQPPESLLHTCWPWLDFWRQWLETDLAPLAPERALGQAPIDPALVSSEPATAGLPPGVELRNLSRAEEDRTDMAAQGFLGLLDKLRTIFLQDSVILRKEFPEHPIWRQEIFVREDYREFAAQVERATATVEEPFEVRLRNLLPDIASSVSNSHHDLVRRLDVQAHETHSHLQTMQRSFDDLFAGRLAITIHGSGQQVSLSPDARTTAMLPPARPTSQTPIRTIESSASSSLASTPCPGPRSTSSSSNAGPVTGLLPPPETPSYGRPSSEAYPVLDPATPYLYKMSRTINTVPDLWREWTQGVGSSPSVRSLEDLYGCRWRPSQCERVFFGRRKRIITEIERRHRWRTSPGEISTEVEALEAVRLRLKTSLYGLSEWVAQQE